MTFSAECSFNADIYLILDQLPVGPWNLPKTRSKAGGIYVSNNLARMPVDRLIIYLCQDLKFMAQ